MYLPRHPAQRVPSPSKLADARGIYLPVLSQASMRTRMESYAPANTQPKN
jgi:hypothetical protein